MNQRQRDFLLNKIDQKYRDERDALEEMRPEMPSLNNYLIAAFLDGTIKFQNMEQFKKKFIERVKAYSSNESLCESVENNYSYRNRKSLRETTHVTTVPTEELFVLPKAYLEALKKYTDACERIDSKLNLLEQHKETIDIKINLGSNTHLQSMIEQADNLASLHIVNAQLKLSAS